MPIAATNSTNRILSPLHCKYFRQIESRNCIHLQIDGQPNTVCTTFSYVPLPSQGVTSYIVAVACCWLFSHARCRFDSLVPIYCNLGILYLWMKCLDRRALMVCVQWSFGVVVWELLTRGICPYPEVDNWDVIEYIKSGRRLPKPSYCPVLLYVHSTNSSFTAWQETVSFACS